jgi:FAD:protein FMN transferase
MSMRWMAAVGMAVVLARASGSGTALDRTYTVNYENVLGTSLELRVRAANGIAAQQAEQAVLGEITRQSRILSSWDPASEVSRWTRTQGQPVPVSRELFEVLDLYDQWRTRSTGVIEPAAQAAIALWKKAAAEQRIPNDTERAAAVAAMRQRHWTLDRATQTATHLSTTPLVFGSFTKSYIMDKAADRARQIDGVHGLTLNVGGDVVTRGLAGEVIALANPRDDAENSAPISTILVHDRTVATSGDYRRGVDIAGRHYSHILDPRTGVPAGNVISATVVADTPTDAGALATAFTVLTPAESRALAASIPGTEYLLVTAAGERVKSTGWNALEAAAGAESPTRPAPAAAALAQTGTAASFDPSMELAVAFEIPTMTVANYKRPFIAIWIEDADKFPLRTLALWYHEDRWLTESKAWYRADRLRGMSETTSIVRSIGAATRPAGKYTIKWDGKDNAGKPVKPGTYTVFLESVREHGTYQIIRQEMTFTGAPQHFDFKPGSELGPVSFDYRKVGQ